MNLLFVVLKNTIFNNMEKILRFIISKSREMDHYIRRIVNFFIFENAASSFMITTFIILFILIKFNSKTDIYQKLSIIFTSIGSLSIILTFVVSHRTSTIRHYAEREGSIFLLERSNLRLLTKIQKNNYKNLKMDNGEFYSYELMAHQSLKLCSEIYAEQLWERTLRKHFIPLFERIRKVHWNWFKDNSSLFKKDFVKFMKYAEWRNLLAQDQADQLRWIYEVDLYEKVVLSPLNIQLRQKLITKIEDTIENFLPGNNNLKIMDVGCGDGTLLELILNIPKIVDLTGIDYSPNMVAKAQEKISKISSAKTTKKISIYNLDMRDLSEIASEKFDIVFSINSILPRNHEDLPLMLQQISSILKDKGIFIAILPSFDTVLDLKKLDEEKLKQEYIAQGVGNSANKAHRDIDKIYRKRMLDVSKGIYADDGVNPQKFFKESEISMLFGKVGLVTRTLDKFYYPWEMCKQYNWGYHPLNEEAIYDWFFVAHKKKINN